MKSGKVGLIAQILKSPLAVLTLAACRVQPRYPHPVAYAETRGIGAGCLHHAHDLVSGNDGQLRQREVTLDRVQVGVAHSARMDSYADFLWPGGRLAQIRLGQRVVGHGPWLSKEHRSHGWVDFSPKKSR
jgi:hypothetical protein